MFSWLDKDGGHAPIMGFAERIFVFHPKLSYFYLWQTGRHFAVRRNARDKVFIDQHEVRLIVVAGSGRLGRERDRYRARARV